MLEMTDKDYLKHKVKEIDPLVLTRHDFENETNNVEDGIIPYGVPRELLTQLKKSNADIAEITIIDCYDPDYIENYDNIPTEYDAYNEYDE